MESESRNSRPHAVCIPFPFQGHINPMMQLAKLLKDVHGFHITFVHTENNYNRIVEAGGGAARLLSDQRTSTFTFETIPDGVSPTNGGGDQLRLVESTQKNFRSPFSELVKRLKNPVASVTARDSPPVTCIISDVLMTFAMDVAEEVGIPHLLFSTSSAASCLVGLYLDVLLSRGFVPIKDARDLSRVFLDTPIDFIPGMKKLTLRYLLRFNRLLDPDDIMLHFISVELQRSRRSRGLIVHTMDELELSCLHAMATSFMNPPYTSIYTVGPLPLLASHQHCSNLHSNEDERCIQWLNERSYKPRSVIYINFGSTTTLTDEQMIELAWGLSSCDHDFLWVIRPGQVTNDDGGKAVPPSPDDRDVLPTEFMSVVSDGGRGLLAKWCSQMKVLSHVAVGGFLTHCGWNSTMESVSCGIPVICFPFAFDQQLNSMFLCHEWGMGMEIMAETKSSFDDRKMLNREEVRVLVNELMGEGDKGREMRKKAMEWKEKAADAAVASLLNLDRAIKEVLLVKT